MTVKKMMAATAAVAILLLGGSGHAQGNSACKADREKLCAGVEKGQGRILDCLRNHADELSPECRQHLERGPQRQARKGGQGGRGLRGACKAELQEHCGETGRERDALLGCLTAHEAELSDTCRSQLEVLQKRMAARAAKRAEQE